jgi:hypothetical protein
VHYPGAVVDPDTGESISDAEVAEVNFTAFASTKTPVTARLIVRRVRDRAKTAELFPVWRYHPFFTNSTEPTAQADLTHRRHAIIETCLRRPDRRTAGPPALRPVRRQRCLGDLRGHHPQPATRRRHPRQRPARRRSRRHPAPAPGRRPRPASPPATPPDPAPTGTLALDPTVDNALDQPHRTTSSSLNHIHPPHRPQPQTTVEKLGRPATQRRPQQATNLEDHLLTHKIIREVDPRIEA